MTEGKPFLLWPGADDRIVVREMLRDSQSEQWYKCREFVKKIVQMQAKNIPKDHQEDIVQEVMIRVNRYLPTFQYRCSVKTWLFGIIHNCIADAYRKLKHTPPFAAPSGDPLDDTEYENDMFAVHAPVTVEDVCITRDELKKALEALQEYVSTHANPVRNQQILNMVLLEDRSLEEAARAVGCSAAMASYVVRSAQRYVRERLGY
jgi:RNA polymerase sigma factor (sigma-70 family)